MDPWQTTSTLLNGLRDFRNQTTWDEFAARFREPIVQFARRLGLSSAEADDVAQETLLAFASAYRDGKYDRSRGRLSSWLFGIAFRQVQSARRIRGRLEALAGGGDDGASLLSAVPDEAEASHAWEDQWETTLVNKCLEHVRHEVAGPTYRAFELVVVHGKPPAEVAETLGLSRDSVYKAKHRVLKRVRELKCQWESVS